MQKQGIRKQLLCDDCVSAVSLATRAQPARRLPTVTQCRAGGPGQLPPCRNILLKLNVKPHFQKQPKHSGCKLPQKANKSQSSERYPDFGRKSAPLTLAGTVASLVSHLALYSVRCSVSSRTSQTNKHSFSNLHVSEISVSEAHMPLDSTYKSQLRVTATSYRTGGMLINQWVIIH